MLLTRNDLLAANQCQRRAWLQLHPPLGVSPEPLFSRADDRAAVRAAARSRFPRGLMIPNDRSLEERVDATRRAMADAEVEVVYDAVFLHADIMVRAAIAVREEAGWMLAEAKSANSIGEAHQLDLAAVGWVAEQSGVPVTRLLLMHLNRDYVRGGELDVRQLFVEVMVEPLDFGEQALILRGATEAPEEPAVRPGSHCGHPRDCPFRPHCTPGESVYSVQRLPKQGRLHAELSTLGVDDVRDIPRDVRMSPMQQHAAWAMVNQQPYVGQGLLPTLSNVRWPLRFLDFEACQPAVPRWPGTSPFEQLPCQWSMHVQHADGRLEHLQFLHTEDSDPRPAFVKSLVAAAGDGGSIIVYSSYEASTLRALRDRLADAWSDLEGIVARMFDLLPVVRDHYYHPAQGGSFSIKALLPAVMPGLSYDDLDISDGGSAAQAWLRMISPGTAPEERTRIRSNLLAYCERDTYAMVMVRDALLRACGAPPPGPRG